MDIQTVSIVLAGIGIFIAAVNSIITSRQANQQRERELETRQAELFMQIFNRWTDPEFAKHYGAARYQYEWTEAEELQKMSFEPFNSEMFAAYHSLNTFFEGIGILVQRGLIDLELVDDFFAKRIIWFWERMKTWFTYIRNIRNDPTRWKSVEYLYNEMMKRQ